MNRDRRLEALFAFSPALRGLIERWNAIALPDVWLSGSVMAQTVWNARFGLMPEYGIADLDLVYFDGHDLSQEGEERHAARLRLLFADMPWRIDVKNQARVHLWYEARFGYAIAPYRSARDAMATFPTTASAVGIRPSGNGFALHAPFGVDDLLNGIVRPNKAQITRAIYEAKLVRWRQFWPDLTIIPW